MESGKFWEKAQSSSSKDTSESEAESSDSSIRVESKTPVVPSRWAAAEDSSSDEDEKRVVRSAKEKQWNHLKQTIKAMNNYKNIDDFAELQTGLETLVRGIHKARITVEKEGVPKFFIQALAELEDYVSDKFSNKEALKKLTKAKSTSFNILRSKVRKNLEEYREHIQAYRLNPLSFIEEKSDSSVSDEESVSGSSETSYVSSSEEELDEKTDESETDLKDKKLISQKKKPVAGTPVEELESSFSEEEGWKSDSSSEDEFAKRTAAPGDEEASERGLKNWGKKKAETKGKSKMISKVAEKKKISKLRKGKHEASAETALLTRIKATLPIFGPNEKIDTKTITKKLREITALRGRKGFDRQEQIRQLHEIVEISATVSIQSQMEALSHLISAYFDANLGVFIAIPPAQWNIVYDQISKSLSLFREHTESYFPLITSEEEAGSLSHASVQIKGQITDVEQDGTSSLAQTINMQIPVQSELDLTTSKDITKLRLNTIFVLTNYLERLDEELNKALQLADIHSEDYKIRLKQTIDILVLFWKAYVYFSQVENGECVRIISLRILEHTYYKNNKIASRMWDMVRKRLDSEDAQILSIPNFEAAIILKRLARHCLSEAGASVKAKVRAILYLAYNSSLSGLFYEARDLLQTANIQELALQCTVSTQVLYNRNLLQLGLAAFSLGLTAEAYTYLSDVCNMGRYKELLAQGMSTLPRGIEKTPEQERLEKRRLLPYHMHIPADFVENVHNICAMLLEVPYMTANSYDYTKKPIARNFRKLLEIYDRQIFMAPPENSRETIMAATKSLQKGDWKTCFNYLLALKIWDSFPNPLNVQEVIRKKVQEEALKTYLFRYSVWYDSFSVKQLAEMFGLPVSMTHSIVSKMMIQGSLLASWDGSAECVLINRIKRTPLQIVGLQLTEKLVSSTEQMELLLAYKNPKFLLTQASQRDDRSRRYDDRWVDRRQQYGGDWFDQRGTGQRWDHTGFSEHKHTRFARQHVVVGDRTDVRLRRR